MGAYILTKTRELKMSKISRSTRRLAHWSGVGKGTLFINLIIFLRWGIGVSLSPPTHRRAFALDVPTSPLKGGSMIDGAGVAFVVGASFVGARWELAFLSPPTHRRAFRP